MADPDPTAFANLAALLKRRLALIADHEFRDRDATAHLAALKEVSEAIVREQERLSTATPPRLSHFLDSCSYDKALDFIEAARSRGAAR